MQKTNEQILNDASVPTIEVAKSPDGSAPVDNGVPEDNTGALASTYSQEGTGVKVDINATQQQQDIESMQKGLETAQVPEKLPDEQYAGISNKISAWGAKNLLKVLRKDAAKPKKFKVPKGDNDIDSIAGYEDIKLESADTLTGRSTDEFRTDDTWQTNFNMLENEDDVNGLIATVSEEMKDQTMEARGGIMKDKEVMALADDLGTDPEFVLEFINSSKSDFNSPEKILAARQVMNNSASYLHDLAKIVSTGDASPNQQLAFKKQYAFHQQFTSQFMAKRANVGRALRAYGLPTGSGDAQADHVQEMLHKVHGGLDIENAAKQIAAAPNAKAVHGIVDAQDSLMRQMGNVFIENFVNSILSGVKTHIINTTGSMMMIGMKSIDTALAARLGTHVDDLAMKVDNDEWKAGVFGMINGAQDAFGVMTQVMKTAEPYGGVSKLENNGRAYISAEYLGIKGSAGTVVDVIGSVIRAPTERLMGGVDGFMKTIAERQSLAALAYRKANAEGNALKLSKEEILQKVADYMNNPSEDMIDEAAASALHVTFQTPLGDWGKNIQKAAGSNPFTQYFMPFVKTPANLMKQGFLERTPLAYITKQFQDDVAAGGARAQMAKARVYTGTFMAMSAGALVMTGVVTGSGGSNPKARQAKMDAGWRPYSFVFTDENGKKTYVSYKRTEPLSYVLSTIADLHETLNVAPEVGEDEQRYAERVTGALIASISNASLDRSFLTGLESAMELMSDPTPTRVQSYMKRFANAQVPYSGLRRDISRVFDDTKKLTDSWSTEIQANIPYYNSALPDRLDALGYPIKYDTVFNPLPIVGERNNLILDEAARVADIVYKNPIQLPQKLINGVRLTARQYHDLIKYSRDTEHKGKTFKETITTVIKSKEYEYATDDMKYDLLRSVTSTFDELGRNKLFENDEDLFMRAQERMLKQSSEALAKKRGEDSMSIYETLKIKTENAYDKAFKK